LSVFTAVDDTIILRDDHPASRGQARPARYAISPRVGQLPTHRTRRNALHFG
jgi:hypothetical protein